MKLFFLDDARQNSPSRAGMGPLVAVGGICVSDKAVGGLEREIDSLCRNKYKFPAGEEFKWSPGRELWMRSNLVDEERSAFYQDVVHCVEERGGVAVVVIEDCNYRRATKVKTPEMDVALICLERVCNQCTENPPEGLVFTDRTMGGGAGDDKFLRDCLDNLQSGSGYLRWNSLALNVVSTPSKFIRLLQVADLVTGATLAAVGGEYTYSTPIVEKLKRVYRKNMGNIGGYGVKIHPDFKYANLYHWVFGDTHFVRVNTGYPLPMESRPYATSTNKP